MFEEKPTASNEVNRSCSTIYCTFVAGLLEVMGGKNPEIKGNVYTEGNGFIKSKLRYLDILIICILVIY